METERPSHFITELIDRDNETGKFGRRVHTRFPPEPNGYLHLGHAKSICLNFGLAGQYGGKCNLRFDDTNPSKEEQEFVDSIQADVRWMGFNWNGMYYASDYFEQIYQHALILVNKGLAYVDDLTAEETRLYRGTLTEPGKDSPYRNRTVDENLDLFTRMRAGEFPDGSRTLRAKIDMASGNINLRDPVMYRIMRATHHRTGDAWCIYPMYDWAHGLCDSIEGITHSICTIEFEDHRPLYDWFIDALGIYHPQQVEFARLNLSYTVLSKRKLTRLVKEGVVSGWDDPRMPTLSGVRRRGYTASAIRAFCDRIGVAKANSTIDIALLEHHLREDLNKSAPRVMAVLRPIKLVITNYPEGQIEELVAENNPEDPSAGTRTIEFSREVYIEQDDFMEEPSKKFFRLAPGREVRLKHAYIIKCEEVIKNSDGTIKELRCTYDPESRSGMANAERKVKGTLHWASVAHAVDAEVRLFEGLFTKENPDDDKDADFLSFVNPNSIQTLRGCKLEPSLGDAKPGTVYQFMRLGYFCPDSVESKAGHPVFNRTITLKDTWAKLQQKSEGGPKG